SSGGGGRGPGRNETKRKPSPPAPRPPSRDRGARRRPTRIRFRTPITGELSFVTALASGLRQNYAARRTGDHCPKRLAPSVPGHRTPEGPIVFHTILVPLDGSPLAEQALPLALSVARRARADLRLALVHRRHPGGPEADVEASRAEQAYLDKVA